MDIFKFNNRDIGVDLGTDSILVTLKEKGIVLKEPTVIAIDKTTNEVIAIGNEAKQMIGKNPEEIDVIRPLRNGVIADCNATELLLKAIMKKICARHNIKKPRVVVGVPSGITEVEERAVEEVFLKSGSKEVYLIEEPMAAAIGAGLDVSEPAGSIIVDIGAGTTEVAVISLGGIVVSNSIKVAGDKLDEDIINYVKREFNLLIGDKTAQTIKEQIGCATPLLAMESATIKGRDLNIGLPKEIIITSEQVREAIEESLNNIVESIKTTLEKTPPELASDLAQKGIWLAGGGAMLRNIEELISYRTKMVVYISDTPIECVVRGTKKSLENITKLKNISINKRNS